MIEQRRHHVMSDRRIRMADIIKDAPSTNERFIVDIVLIGILFTTIIIGGLLL